MNKSWAHTAARTAAIHSDCFLFGLLSLVAVFVSIARQVEMKLLFSLGLFKHPMKIPSEGCTT